MIPDVPVSPMALLASGIPLSLLIDLAWLPDSESLLAEEGAPNLRT